MLLFRVWSCGSPVVKTYFRTRVEAEEFQSYLQTKNEVTFYIMEEEIDDKKVTQSYFKHPFPSEREKGDYIIKEEPKESFWVKKPKSITLTDVTLKTAILKSQELANETKTNWIIQRV